jgi:glycosyltransferase involved in cell wall biosynthesis
VRLDAITPIVLTYNEASNIGRVLDRLSWAKQVIVVDSHSSDATQDIVRHFANARMFARGFDCHAAQWQYALDETGIETEWVLSLDADYILSAAFVDEMASLMPSDGDAAYEARFRFCIRGHPLPRSILPPRIVLFRRARGRFYQDGHTQRLAVTGNVGKLTRLIDHDDRKSITHWIGAQDQYAKLERDKLTSMARADLRGLDRIRRLGFMAPIATLIYCLFVKRLILAGPSGLYYTYQRVTAEILLSLYLIEERLARRDPPS